ncbi:unnamed protein product, partial [Vitis vinifera]|uniref:Uncharacterized protein n=1 Tax=Vitis vinifera TaxID=29760 RepID=D7TRK3_VITVI
MHQITLTKHYNDSFFIEKCKTLKVIFCFAPYPHYEMADSHFWMTETEDKTPRLIHTNPEQSNQIQAIRFPIATPTTTRFSNIIQEESNQTQRIHK